MENKMHGGAQRNNYERIKSMTIDEMARELTELMCRECGYQDDWTQCNQVGCWCHKNNGYQAFGQWLLSKSTDDVRKMDERWY